MSAARAPARPLCRYHGGKWRLAPWIISMMPGHRVYVEPFGGAASVLMQKTPSIGEVYNDLDGEMVNVFRVLRDPAAASRLQALLELTPYARAEFDLAYEPSDDPVEQARRTLTKAGLAFGTSWRRKSRTGFRATPVRATSTTGINDWRTFPPHVPQFVERMRRVLIENRSAIECIQQQDRADTLFYVDPPYHPETRAIDGIARHRAYAHELDHDGHVELLEVLREVEGMVMLSGYDHEIYKLDGWHRVEKRAANAHGGHRLEALWMNAAAYQQPRPLFP